MRERLSRILLSLACVLSLALLPFASAYADPAKLFAVIFSLLYHGFLLGEAFFKQTWPRATLMGTVLIIALQSIVQTIWYYSGKPLGTTSDAAGLIAGCIFALAAWLIISQNTGPREKEFVDPWTIRRIIASLVLFLVSSGAFAFIVRGAARSATTETIRTAWPLMPEGTLLAIAVVWLACIIGAYVVRSGGLTAIQSALGIGAVTSIAPLIYRIGFGFDGFLHTASEKIILATGTLSPKPLYYIGQYVFTTWLARLSDLPIAEIDRWLVPAAAAFLLPLSALLAAQSASRTTHPVTQNGSTLPLLTLAFVPLASFVATTPQGFAFVLVLAAFFLCRGLDDGSVNPLAPTILAAWAAAVHPLAGVPAGIVVLAAALMTRRHRVSHIASGVLLVCSALAVPVMFYLLSQKSGTPINWNFEILFGWDAWAARFSELRPWVGNRFVLWPAWSSLVSRALPLILLALAIFGIAIARMRTAVVFTVAAVLLWISSAALKTAGEFAFLIDYERGNYAERLTLLAIFCLVVAARDGLAAILDRARYAPRLILFAVIIFCAVIPTALAYDALPRHDALVTGRGWSTSRHDIAAVTLIERDAAGRDYTVLANQSVSAAAVATLGFKRYAGDVFFYPIPTGGPLYEAYLKMTYEEPSLDTAKDAARLGDADLVYVVLNRYWWRAEEVAEALNGIADTQWEIGDRDWQVRVYKIDLSADSSASTDAATR